MSKTDILDHPDLRKVWDTLESAAPTAEWDDLNTHSPVWEGGHTSVRPRGPLLALAVFVTIILIGGVTWQLSGNGSQPLAAGEAAAAYFAFASEGALVLGEDPLILQPAQGPEPQFDTSALGTEVLLIPASTMDDIPDGFLSASDGTAGREAGVPLVDHCVRAESWPILHIGYVGAIDARLLVYGTVSDGRGDYIFEGGPGPDQYGEAIACDGFSGYPHGASVRREGSSGVLGYLTVEVPPSTSVVTVSIDDGELMWQRPVAGWSLFPYSTHGASILLVDAYDAAGTLIGHWEETG